MLTQAFEDVTWATASAEALLAKGLWFKTFVVSGARGFFGG